MKYLISSSTIYFLLLVRTGAVGVKPDIEPNVEALNLDEGQSLKLTCSSHSKHIKFHYPRDNNAQTTSTVSIDSWETNGINYAVLQRPYAVYGDTGYYGCANSEEKAQNDDKSYIRWIYVYVKSNTSFFVSNDDVDTIHSNIGGSVMFPCRPTSPHHTIIVKHNYEDLVCDDRVSFDPRIGLTLHNVSLQDSGYYTCEIIIGEGESEALTYILRVDNVQELLPPRILDGPLRHVTLGQTLRVNCTVEMRAVDLACILNWTIPHPSSRFKINSYQRNIGSTMLEITSELQIVNVQNEDAGVYQCILTTHYHKLLTNRTFTIHDPDNKFIHLIPQHPNTNYIRSDGEDITWVVRIDAYPPPEIISWSLIDANNKENEVKSSARIKITNTMESTMLAVKNLKISDMGHYLLRVISSDGHSYIDNATLHFFLEVTSKPFVDEFGVQEYYLPNKWVNVTCRAVAYPAPKIFWTFSPLSTMPDIYPIAADNPQLTETFSTISLWTNTSGYLNCSSCNDRGCDSVVRRISISEVPEGFGIIPLQPEEITVGDDIILTCVAPIHNFTDNLKWLYENHGEIANDDRHIISHAKSEFSHQIQMQIIAVHKTDAQIYTCKGEMLPEGEIIKDYRLEIFDASMPAFLNDTNLYKLETIYSAGIDALDAIILNCFVDGIPTPIIRWFKDDLPLDLSHSFSITSQDYTLINRNQSLYIEHLLDRVSGTYTCKARNKVGEISSWQRITIKSKEVSKDLITLIIVLIVLVIALVTFFSIKDHRQKALRKQLMEAGLTHFEDGALECLNPELTLDDQAELLPYDKKWEFPRERLKFGKQLGYGAFGVVMKAEARRIVEEEDVTTVAVKMVKRSTESIHIRALASELKIMVHLGRHLNVVNLLGACTENITKRELLVIVEYCRYGNLHNYLLRHRSGFVNQIDPSTGKIDVSIGLDVLTRSASLGSKNSSLSGGANDVGPYTPGPDSLGMRMLPDRMVPSSNSVQPAWRSNYRGDYKDFNLKPISTQDLLSWAFQVARGMEYLSQRRVLHGDLAARNILLAEDNIVKICDFGLAKTMYKDGNYKKKGDAPLPIKWMAIESIRDRMFSTQSDIWSFGIVLWEFFTLGKTPYPGMEAEKQYEKLVEGYRMENPEFATPDVYDIMLQCWEAKPMLRPSFAALTTSIGNLLDESIRIHYVALNTPYMDMNTLIKNDYLTMMSAPDHDFLSSPIHYINTPCISDDSYLVPNKEVIIADYHAEAVELSPMLNTNEDDDYVQPINVAERRAKFAKHREPMMKIPAAPAKADEECDSEWCTTSDKLDIHEKEIKDEIVDVQNNDKETNVFRSGIIGTQDNYVNMPRDRSNMKRKSPDSFTNPSYLLIGN